MDWLVDAGGFWLVTLQRVGLLGVLFGVLARLMPCNPGMYWWKDLRAVGTDFMYWFVVPLVLSVCRQTMILAGVVLLFGGRDPHVWLIDGLPFWVQCPAILLLQDVILYAVHRVFHTRLGWGFHATHHSPKVLDWTATARFHPVNNLLEFAVADVAVLMLGFSPEALALLVPFNVVYSAMVHANLNWTFGPLRYVLASPVFHRWHHTTEEEGLDKNFASTFPFLDLMFGTFYMPAGKLPEKYGNSEPDFPEGFWGQLVYPFRVKEAQSGKPASWPGPIVLALLAGNVLAAVAVVGWLCLPGAPGTEERKGAEPGGEQAGAVSAAPKSPVLSVAVGGPAGEVLAFGTEDGMVKVDDPETLQERLVLHGHTRAVRSVAVSADGQWIVSGSFDKTVKVWDVRSGRETRTITGHTSHVLAVGVSADGSRIVSAGADGTVKVWDESGAKVTLGRNLGAVPGAALSADGGRVVAANYEMAKVWDVKDEKERSTLKGHKALVYGVAISGDGKRIVTGGFDNLVKVWDAETGEEKASLTGHTGPVYSVALSADGRWVVSGSKDGTVKLWDLETGSLAATFAGHADAVTGVAVRADGRIYSGSRDGTVKAWRR
jgi:sterol desaturase/sphingolipid hydroxylase (fatty acid hydroxylase superfamily)